VENVLWSWLQSISVPALSSHVRNQDKAEKNRLQDRKGYFCIYILSLYTQLVTVMSKDNDTWCPQHIYRPTERMELNSLPEERL